jgi:hypothetical protein
MIPSNAKHSSSLSLTLYVSVFRPSSCVCSYAYICLMLEVELTLRLTVSQYVLVSSTLVGLMTRYYFLSVCCSLKFAVLYLWGALSDETTGLQFEV